VLMSVARVSALCIQSQSLLGFFGLVDHFATNLSFVDAVHPEVCGFYFDKIGNGSKLHNCSKLDNGRPDSESVMTAMIATLHCVTGTLSMSYFFNADVEGPTCR
jgi:hypothetical protein